LRRVISIDRHAFERLARRRKDIHHLCSERSVICRRDAIPGPDLIQALHLRPYNQTQQYAGLGAASAAQQQLPRNGIYGLDNTGKGGRLLDVHRPLASGGKRQDATGQQQKSTMHVFPPKPWQFRQRPAITSSGGVSDRMLPITVRQNGQPDSLQFGMTPHPFSITITQNVVDTLRICPSREALTRGGCVCGDEQAWC
jgi:hypothetical protein